MNDTEKLKHFAQICLAAADGAKIETRQSENHPWKPVPDISYYNAQTRWLRIKPDPSQEVAKGANRHGLTVAKVGEGYRLLDEDEIYPRPRVHEEIENWFDKSERWDATGWGGQGTANTYRTRLSREELAALDAPKVEYWSRPEHVPGPVCWVRKHGEYPLEMMVVSVWDNGLAICDSSGVIKLGWGKCCDLEHSTDRTNWQPCTTEAR